MPEINEKSRIYDQQRKLDNVPRYEILLKKGEDCKKHLQQRV